MTWGTIAKHVVNLVFGIFAALLGFSGIFGGVEHVGFPICAGLGIAIVGYAVNGLIRRDDFTFPL